MATKRARNTPKREIPKSIIHPTKTDLRRIGRVLQTSRKGFLGNIFTKEEIRFWVIKAWETAYAQGVSRGVELSKAAARTKQMRVEELVKLDMNSTSRGLQKRNAARNRFIEELAPDLIPDEKDIPKKFTAEEMELVAEKDQLTPLLK